MRLTNLFKQAPKKIILAFFVGSLFTGLIFGCITRIPNQAQIWFTKGDKFYVPTRSYWIGLSISLVIGLMCSYTYVRIKKLYTYGLSVSLFRHMLSALIIIAAYPGMDFIDRFLWRHLDWEFIRRIYIFVSPILIAVFISLSMYVFTKRWDLLVFFLIIAVCFLVSVFSNVVLVIFHIPYNYYELVLFSSNHSFLATLCSFWLIRASKSANVIQSITVNTQA